MLSKETESKIVNILKTIASGETSVEVNRRLLSDNLDFDPYQIFSNLIQKGKEYITPVDIQNYFNTKQVFISYTEAKLLILFYDQNYDGVLTYTEFLKFIQSKNSEKKNVVNSPTKEMNNDIDYYLNKLFQKEVDLIREIIELLYDLRIKNDFDCHEIYHAIKNVNKITEDSIGDFFEKNDTSFLNDDLIAIMKRLDINKDGIIDLCELHAFFGFPNCTFCCSCTPCPKCTICCCKECLPDIPCYLHKCVHHQDHSPLETKTLCKSPLREQNINVSDFLCPKYNENINVSNTLYSKYNEKTNASDILCSKYNKKINVSDTLCSKYNKNINVSDILCSKYNENENFNNISNCSYKFNTLRSNNKYADLDFNKENNNKYDSICNNNLRNIPDIKNSFVLESKNTELKNDYNSPCKRYSSPKKYFINSQSDFGSTLYSTSPMNDNFSQSILSKGKKTLNDNDMSKTFFGSFSNSFKNLNKNEFEEEQFKEYLKTLMATEKEIEKAKKELSLCNNFNYEDCFKIFDIDGTCYITYDNFKQGLKYIGLETNDDEIQLLFNKFDYQKCGGFNCDNFMNVLNPHDNIYRNKFEKRLGHSYRGRGGSNLSYEAKLYFKNILKLIISQEKKLNKLKQGYLNLNNNLRNIFDLIDINGMGYFYENDLKNYLRKNGILASDKCCNVLFLKLDKNRDGKVDISEFEDEFKIIY